MTGNGPGHGGNGGLGSADTDINSGSCFQFWPPEPCKRCRPGDRRTGTYHLLCNLLLAKEGCGERLENVSGQIDSRRPVSHAELVAAKDTFKQSHPEHLIQTAHGSLGLPNMSNPHTLHLPNPLSSDKHMMPTAFES